MEVVLASLITLLTLGTMIHLVNAKLALEESLFFSRLSLITGLLNIVAIIVLLAQLITYRTEAQPQAENNNIQRQTMPDLYDGDPLTIQVYNNTDDLI